MSLLADNKTLISTSNTQLTVPAPSLLRPAWVLKKMV